MHEVARLYEESFSSNPEEALWSPPDIFAICCYFAKITGAYRVYSNTSDKRRADITKAQSEGRRWRTVIDGALKPKDSEIPATVVTAWRYIGKNVYKSLDKLSSSSQFIDHALYLIAATDEACAGVGIPGGALAGRTGVGGYFEFLAEIGISDVGSLCRLIPSSSIRVLPKQHTPQSGFNIRSLTHHLALCSASEVTPIWSQMPLNISDESSYNVLLAPWPIAMDASDLKPANKVSNASQKFGYFDYEPNQVASDAKVFKWVKDLLAYAKKIGQRIDLILLPECALTTLQWKRISKHVADSGIAIISGVRASAEDGSSGENSLRMKLPFYGDFELVQHKHHRWQIESSQIKNYGLGGTLCSKKYWWENIKIEPRALNFLALRPDLVLCPLICEDLARQDPVAELVRSVGPNLVIALLMDGPQVPERWSARYASVLADDPGSSVLTISSLGMVQLSRPQNCRPKRVFASWKDATGSFVPLELASNEIGLVLNLQFSQKTEWSVDGRHDGEAASSPVLCGIHPIVEEMRL